MQSDEKNDIFDAHIIPNSGLCLDCTKYRGIVDPIFGDNRVHNITILRTMWAETAERDNISIKNIVILIRLHNRE